MWIGRLIGLMFMALACLAVGAEIVRSLEAAGWDPLALGQLWYDVHPASLNLSQAVVQRYLHPALWDPAMITVLQAPAWLVTGILGIAFAVAFRRRQPRRLFRPKS
jgi:hypothetical protein